MTITSAEGTKANKMVRIFIDNHYAFTIPQEDYIRNCLYEAEEITEEQLDHIRRTVLVRAAKERGLRYLLVRDRSEGEIIRKLTEAGFDPEIARGAADELKALGYLNDSRYAMRYLAERVKTKSLSKKALRYELEQKGIDRDIIDSVLSEYETSDGEVALRAVRKKFGKYDLHDQKVEKKILNFLFHRGFSFETSQQVLKSMKSDQN